MIIAFGRLVALVVSTVIVVAVSAVVWPLDSALHKLASSGAKLCFAYDETLLVGARLEGDEFGDEDVIAAASIPSMQRLSLNGSKVTLQGLQSLQSLPKLVSLSLNDTNLSVEAFTILCGLPALRELELDRCRWVADEHLELLAGMKKLEFVSLAENSISTAGIDRLRQVPSLRFVRLDRCRQIDDSAIDAIVHLCEGSVINVGLSGTDVTQQGLLHLHAALS